VSRIGQDEPLGTRFAFYIPMSRNNVLGFTSSALANRQMLTKPGLRAPRSMSPM
jgi:hypothetical protein